MKIKPLLKPGPSGRLTIGFASVLLLLLLSIAASGLLSESNTLRHVFGSQITQQSTLFVAIAIIAVLGTLVSTLNARVSRLKVLHDEENRAALHDELTGAANRRQFDILLRDLLCADDQSHALLMIDLDRFKPVNDLYGHAAGDALLIEITAGLQRNIGHDDLVARLGGDEFAVLLKNRTATRAEKCALDILQFVSKYRLNWEGQRLGVGASIGVVPFSGTSRTSAQLLAAADEALYSSKEAGRNTIFVAERKNPGDLAVDFRQLIAPVDLPAPNTRSHLPADGRQQELNARLLSQISAPSDPERRRARGARRRHEIKHWVYIEPQTCGDAMSPGMNMRELVSQAATHQDGGADFARWIMGMTQSCASTLNQITINCTDFILPLPAQALVAAPDLADELMRSNALSRLPLRHITYVLHGAEQVYKEAMFKQACHRFKLSEVRLAIELCTDSVEALSPLRCVQIDELHAGRELVKKIKPTTTDSKTLDALAAVSHYADLAFVAPCVDNEYEAAVLASHGVCRIGAPSLKATGSLRSLLDELNQQ